MARLIPIQYHKTKYPDGIKPEFIEVAGHFDVKVINVEGDYSLHTEYCFTDRKLNSDIIKKLDAITTSRHNGIPQLWTSEIWASQFVEFIIKLTEGCNAPRLIEIHPPFSDYCNLDKFIGIYQIFSNELHSHFPNTKILIENRSGTRYPLGNFIFSDIHQLTELSNQIDQKQLDLHIALDIPQLFTAHKINCKDEYMIKDLIGELHAIRQNILGIHLWGKRKNNKGRWTSHVGTLDNLFEEDKAVKLTFLHSVYELLDDDVERYFVPEVNSGSGNLNSIVEDLLETGFVFL